MGVVADAAILASRLVDIAPFKLILTNLVAGNTELLPLLVEQALVFRGMRGVAGVTVPLRRRFMDVFVIQHLFVMAAETELAYRITLQMKFNL